MNKGRSSGRLSTKRVSISKDQARIVLVLALASSVTAFCLVASRVYFSKMRHQSRVIEAKNLAINNLESNIDEARKLESAYLLFENGQESILGDSEQKNSQLVLNALPSKYDYAAVLSSIEKILNQGAYQLESIDGIDQELEAVQVSSEPLPVEIPISLKVSANYESIQQLVNDFNRSIRPMDVRGLKLSGDQSEMTLTLDLNTFYQPEMKLDISKEKIK